MHSNLNYASRWKHAIPFYLGPSNLLSLEKSQQLESGWIAFSRSSKKKQKQNPPDLCSSSRHNFNGSYDHFSSRSL